jgi:hypothetical protein
MAIFYTAVGIEEPFVSFKLIIIFSPFGWFRVMVKHDYIMRPVPSISSKSCFWYCNITGTWGRTNI